jgi:hypothetical protein
VPSQQLHGKLQTQYNVDAANYIMNKHNTESKNKLQARTGEKNTLIQKSKQTNEDEEW